MTLSEGGNEASVELPVVVSDRGLSPDPEKEIAPIRLLHACGSWPCTPDPNTDPGLPERVDAK